MPSLLLVVGQAFPLVLAWLQNQVEEEEEVVEVELHPFLLLVAVEVH